jgi:RHS repeat-associated protein
LYERFANRIFPGAKAKTNAQPTNTMKLKNYILPAMCALAALSQTSHAALQAALPEFKSKQALQAQAASRQVNKEEASGNAFYTGKPFEADREGYLFKYRSYDPELSRWATTDPSGFPNGSNNTLYAAVPTTQLDSDGLRVFLKVNDFSTLNTDWVESDFYNPYGEGITDRVKDRYRLVFDSWAADSSLPSMVGYKGEALDVSYSASTTDGQSNQISFAAQGDFKVVKVTVGGSHTWSSGTGQSFSGSGHQDAIPNATLSADFVIATFRIEEQSQIYSKQEDGSYTPYGLGWYDSKDNGKTYLGAIGAAFYE